VYPSTVYRYRNTYNHHGREERYLVEKVRGGKDRKRITPEAEKAIEQAINQIYLTPERNSKAVTYEEGRRLCYRNQIKPVPSYNTVRWHRRAGGWYNRPPEGGRETLPRTVPRVQRVRL